MVGEGVPLPFDCWLFDLLERPASPWRLIQGVRKAVQVRGAGGIGGCLGKGGELLARL